VVGSIPTSPSKHIKTKIMFKATENKGFQITFNNGYTISVQFGKGNYCDNRLKENSDFITSCKNAEVAIWNENNSEDMEIIPFQTAEEVAKIIETYSNNSHSSIK
jgi:hypothetical protein